MKYRAEKLVVAHLVVAFVALGIAAVLGAWQMTVRSGINPPLTSPTTYFASVTAHGTIMAYVMPTLFAMGFGYFVAVTSLDRPLPSMRLAWAGFWVAVIGMVLAIIPIVAGKASVLYTFYPPLIGDFSYYFGVLLIVVGSWAWVAIMIWAMAQWKRENPGKPVPLVMFATVANAYLWLWTTLGVGVEVIFQLIPSSLGWSQTVDVGLARTFFAWTLHPIVYFWLLPAYIAFYTIAPQVAGGRLYSDMMARISFVLLILFSLPVGMHHLFMDPEHGATFKFLQATLTALVVLPTLLTIFTISASMEIAGRLRGGKGLLGWIAALPWDRPMVLATGLSFVLLGFGGFGGVVNMAYGMNAMVHNTSWVTAHFHLIFGGSVVIMYFATTYQIWPLLLQRQGFDNRLLRLQLWLWAIGVVVTTFPWHILGLMGQPRRVATFDYSNPAMADWQPWTLVSMVGGFVMLAAALLFLWNLASIFFASRVPSRQMHYAVAVYPPKRMPNALNGFGLWNTVTAFLMLVAFGYPIAQFYLLDVHPALIHRVDIGN
ncbi:cbb3-type cytochrome c oxidase subunit I [Hyphomicrobium sp. 802]|uniref:cbb3-type cytochrome c oxidase subunit I n=1 Tax=Hyphomicrobium sp. 802 TaxID=1112272 RepID=UPI00045EC5AE|nr:cbb3-type cytochrome c oxidase subunit I [Hyphomicrobium sp. 802]